MELVCTDQLDVILNDSCRGPRVTTPHSELTIGIAWSETRCAWAARIYVDDPTSPLLRLAGSLTALSTDIEHAHVDKACAAIIAAMGRLPIDNQATPLTALTVVVREPEGAPAGSIVSKLRVALALPTRFQRTLTLRAASDARALTWLQTSATTLLPIGCQVTVRQADGHSEREQLRLSSYATRDDRAGLATRVHDNTDSITIIHPDSWHLRITVRRCGSPHGSFIDADIRRPIYDAWYAECIQTAWVDCVFNTFHIPGDRPPALLEAVPTMRHMAAGSLNKRIITARIGRLRASLLQVRRTSHFRATCGLCNHGVDDGVPHVMQHCRHPDIASMRARLMRKIQHVAAAVRAAPPPPSAWATAVSSAAPPGSLDWLPDCGPLLEWLGALAGRVDIQLSHTQRHRLSGPDADSDQHVQLGIDRINVLIVTPSIVDLPRQSPGTLIINGSAHTGAGETRWIMPADAMPYCRPAQQQHQPRSQPGTIATRRQGTITIATVGFMRPSLLSVDEWADLWDRWLIGGHMTAFRPCEPSSDVQPDRSFAAPMPPTTVNIDMPLAALGLARSKNSMLPQPVAIAIVRSGFALFDRQMQLYRAEMPRPPPQPPAPRQQPRQSRARAPRGRSRQAQLRTQIQRQAESSASEDSEGSDEPLHLPPPLDESLSDSSPSAESSSDARSSRRRESESDSSVQSVIEL
jgi:hypothetical protein